MAAPHHPRNSLSHLIPPQLNPAHGLRIVGRLVRRATKKPGSAPGTVVYTGPKREEPVHYRVLRYDPDGFRDETWETLPDDLEAPEPGTGTLWVNIDGLHDVSVLERLGTMMGVHPLVIEDIANVGQRPKLEEHDRLTDEQVSIVVGPGFLFSFQQTQGDVFEPVRDRIRSGKGKIRSRGSDYLAYALMDALVDSYFHVLERLGDEAERLETEVIEATSEAAMEALHHLKRELLVLRRSIWPLRDLTSAFQRCDPELVDEATKVYVRDVHDHCYQLIDTVEILRDVTTGIRDLHLSNVSNRTNEVMKVLTVMASVFIPLTFVAGVYGMNFELMPELEWRWGYPGVMLLMAALGTGMLWLFRRKKWI
jgi:magnesium transporter